MGYSKKNGFIGIPGSYATSNWTKDLAKFFLFFSHYGQTQKILNKSAIFLVIYHDAVLTMSATRPKTFDGINMHLMKAITIFITCKFTCTMIHCFMLTSPFRQSRINIIFISKNLCTRFNDWFNKRLYRYLLNIRKHTNKNFSWTLYHSKYEWFFFF